MKLDMLRKIYKEPQERNKYRDDPKDLTPAQPASILIAKLGVGLLFEAILDLLLPCLQSLMETLHLDLYIPLQCLNFALQLRVARDERRMARLIGVSRYKHPDKFFPQLLHIGARHAVL